MEVCRCCVGCKYWVMGKECRDVVAQAQRTPFSPLVSFCFSDSLSHFF
uniref:Ring finger protein 141 n=1 Tax=Molossus molossus TaxID=27622 RepID=A0A7J8EU06_MOLMO|nr:ring finger protein 141 [Molossus molossus]